MNFMAYPNIGKLADNKAISQPSFSSSPHQRFCFQAWERKTYPELGRKSLWWHEKRRIASPALHSIQIAGRSPNNTGALDPTL